MNERPDIYKIIHATAVFALFVFFMGHLMINVWDPDFWWHLATGKWIVEHGRLPEHDPFSFATLQKDPYTPVNRVKFILTQYWLAQILIYKVYSWFGFAGVSFMRALLLTMCLLMVFLLLRLYRVNILLILPVTFLPGYLFRAFAGERPQLFTFFFAGVVIYLLEDIKKTLHQRKRPSPIRYVILPLVMLLWANLHGGFIYGVVVIGIYVTSGWIEVLYQRPGNGEKKDYSTAITLTILAFVAIPITFLNPNTYHALIDHLRYKPFTYLSYIQEYTPPYKAYHLNKGYFTMLFLLTLLILVSTIKSKRVNTSHLLLYLFNTFISLIAERFVPFFLISGAFLIGIYLNEILPMEFLHQRKHLQIAGIIIAPVFIIVLGFFTGQASAKGMFQTGVRQKLYPYGAVNFLMQLPPKRIFNPYTWGGYLIWRLYPKYKVFTDGRGLNQEIFLQYREVVQVNRTEFGGIPKWKAILDSYDIDYIIIAPYHRYIKALALTYQLVNDKDWELVYADDIALIFMRNKKEFEPILRRHSLYGDIVYAIAAGQALERASEEVIREKKLHAYMTAVDALMRINKVEDAKYILEKAYEIAPDNLNVRQWITALGLQEEFR